ncbi:hypothetical protein [Reyranella sp.]|uniref:hypothetical protein n=1 Tax=Reyranella sp. TaxID=1929291 RepID=UPI003BADB274
MSIAGNGLRPDLPVWGFFGRILLAGIGNALIVPAPWTATILYRFLAEHASLPDGRRLVFTGRPGDIWPVLVGIAALPWLHAAAERAGFPREIGVLWMIATWALSFAVLKWLWVHVTTDDGALRLAFRGGFWPYLGWHLLLLVSFVTIIGWAWVVKGLARWILGNVAGTARFEFAASGLAILWRTLVLVLVCVLIIPIPWMLRWYSAWIISQVTVEPPAAA